MKVLYIITRSDVLGGASIHLLDLARGVQELGHQVAILVGGNGIVVGRARTMGLNCIPIDHLVREISPWTDLKGLWELRKKILEFKPDIVHLHSAKAGILGRVAARMASVPAVYTVHGWPFTEGVSERKRSVYRVVERTMAVFCERIITVSEYDKKIAEKVKVGRLGQVATVHNGIPDLDGTLKVASIKDHGSIVRLIMVARFEEPKDHRLVLRALSSIVHLKWHMEFIGDGPNLEAMKVLARDLGVSEKVDFLGARDDVQSRLSASDIFVLVSRWEGFPLTILEAMRAGLPVIASNVGGVSESVVVGETGCLVPRDEEGELRETMEVLILDAKKRGDMGLKGRLRYESEFTFPRMLEKTLDVYSEALEVATCSAGLKRGS